MNDLPDIVRGLTSTVLGLLAGGWLIVAWRARKMPPPQLGPWTLRAFAGFILSLAVLSMVSLMDRHGKPLSTPIVATVIVLALLVAASWAILRDFLRRKR